MPRLTAIIILVVVFIAGVVGLNVLSKNQTQIQNVLNNSNDPEEQAGPKEEVHPLTIESLRKGEYPGSDIVIEQTLDPGSNYQRYIASYRSEGLKIYGLLT